MTSFELVSLSPLFFPSSLSSYAVEEGIADEIEEDDDDVVVVVVVVVVVLSSSVLCYHCCQGCCFGGAHLHPQN